MVYVFVVPTNGVSTSMRLCVRSTANVKLDWWHVGAMTWKPGEYTCVCVHVCFCVGVCEWGGLHPQLEWVCEPRGGLKVQVPVTGKTRSRGTYWLGCVSAQLLEECTYTSIFPSTRPSSQSARESTRMRPLVLFAFVGALSVPICADLCGQTRLYVLYVCLHANWECTLSPAASGTGGQGPVAASHLSGCWMRPRVLNFLKIGSCVSNLNICMLYIESCVIYRALHT